MCGLCCLRLWQDVGTAFMANGMFRLNRNRKQPLFITVIHNYLAENCVHFVVVLVFDI